jgi:Arc/MetJ-type ribon-helix-helix transcriptional regulator
MSANLKRTTIFLTEEQREKLRRIAFEKRTSMAELVREAIIEILEDEEDIREGLKALEENEEGSVTLEELEQRRAESGTAV